MKKAPAMHTETPETPERARRIGRDYAYEQIAECCPHCGAVLFVEFGKCAACKRRVTAPPLRRRVYDQWPLKRLHRSETITDLDYDAGMRYYVHWYASGLSPFQAVDFNRVSRSLEPNVGMASTERQAYHRQMYRTGENALGLRLSSWVNPIVLYEEEPAQVGINHGRSKDQGRAAAIECLKVGLEKLAEAYGMERK